MSSRRRRIANERLATQPGNEKEGQRIGYNDKADNGVSYSSRSEAVDETKLEVFKHGILRAEDLSDITITVFPTEQSDESVNRFPR